MNGVDLIAQERARQTAPPPHGEGYDHVHDRGTSEDLAMAGAIYATPASERWPTFETPPEGWPWATDAWKPTPNDRLRELVKAGALIAAAIDALPEREP